MENNKDKESKMAISVSVSPMSIVLATIAYLLEAKIKIEKIEKLLSNRKELYDVVEELQEDDTFRSRVIGTISTSDDSRAIIDAMLFVSASNSYSTSKKDVVLTAGEAIFPLKLFEVTWERGMNKDKEEIKKINLLEAVKGIDEKVNLNEVISGRGVVGLEANLSVVVGDLSIDTWALLSYIVGQPISPFSGKRAKTSGRFFNMLPLYGNMAYSLMLLCKTEDKSIFSKAVQRDLEELAKGFSNETDK